MEAVRICHEEQYEKGTLDIWEEARVLHLWKYINHNAQEWDIPRALEGEIRRLF
jgi:hypothetical protein